MGTGKTYCALSIAEYLMKDKKNMGFGAEWVAFDTPSFVKCVRKARKGQCIVYDESGVGINSRNFFSENNKSMSYIMQTFRV